MTTWNPLKAAAKNPMESIGISVSVGLVLYGVILVIGSLLNIIPFNSSLVFDNQTSRIVYGTIIGFIGTLYPLEVANRALKFFPHPLMWVFGAYLFLTILRLLTVGLFPLMWVLSGVLAFIAGIVYFWDKRVN